MHTEILERLNRRPDAGKRRQSDILDEHFLGGSRAALHAAGLPRHRRPPSPPARRRRALVIRQP